MHIINSSNIRLVQILFISVKLLNFSVMRIVLNFIETVKKVRLEACSLNSNNNNIPYELNGSLKTSSQIVDFVSY